MPSLTLPADVEAVIREFYTFEFTTVNTRGQFYRLGRRKAKEYLAKRGEPWPPIRFEAIGGAVDEAPE